MTSPLVGHSQLLAAGAGAGAIAASDGEVPLVANCAPVMVDSVCTGAGAAASGDDVVSGSIGCISMGRASATAPPTEAPLLAGALAPVPPISVPPPVDPPISVPPGGET